jgi:hypothetical protein
MRSVNVLLALVRWYGEARVVSSCRLVLGKPLDDVRLTPSNGSPNTRSVLCQLLEAA